ncbi:MAG TPA: hypothetical protein VIQ30_05900 [Pseudonocardia sp.]
MRDEVLDALRSTWTYLASLLGIDPDGMGDLWESIADDVVAEVDMWSSAFAVMPDAYYPGAES